MSEAGADRVGPPSIRRQWLAIFVPGPVAGVVAGLGLGLTLGNEQIFTILTEDYARVPAPPQYIAGMLALCVVGGAIYGLLLGTLAMLLLGLPVHALLRRYTSAGVVVYVIAGLIAGSIFAALFALNTIISDPYSSTNFSLLVAGAVTGTVASLVFWLIRRPDRDGRPVTRSVSSQDHGA